VSKTLKKSQNRSQPAAWPSFLHPPMDSWQKGHCSCNVRAPAPACATPVLQ